MNKEIKKIAVLTSGGDAPGMNAAIRAVVRTARHHDLEVYGVHHGYDGLIKSEIKKLESKDVANIIHRGGTILKTARSQEFYTAEGRKKAFNTLQERGIDGLVVIGGNGTYTGAMHLSKEHDINVVGIPGTIDNDIFGTDYTIGFDTAINTAVEAVDKIRDTADSHTRVFFIEVMGRDSGHIALYTGIGSGASSVFLPETDTEIDEFISNLDRAGKRSKLFNLIIVAEGNKNGGASELVKKVNEANIGVDAKATIIGHLQRGGSPTAKDRVLSSRLAYNAVNALVEGAKNKAVGIVNNHIVLTPFQEAILKTKNMQGELLRMAEILAS